MLSAALWRYLPYLARYRRLLALMVLGQIASLAAATSIPQVIKAVLDGPVAHHHPERFVSYAALLAALATVEFIGVHFRRNLSGVVSMRMECDLRNDFYAHLQRLQVGFHDNWQSGQLLSRAISDINTIRRFAAMGLVFALQTALTYSVVIVLLFGLYPPLAVLVAVGVLPITVLSRLFFKRYGVMARRMQDQQGDLTTIVEEAATGVRIIKAFGRSRLMTERFGAEAVRLRNTNLAIVRLRAQLWTTLALVPNLTLAAVVLAGGLAVVHGQLTFGGLVAFISYIFLLTWPMEALGWILAMSEEARTAADRLSEVFDCRPEIQDAPRARSLERCRGEIRFQQVGFRYPGSEQWVLRGIDLEMRPGETLALVGRTGSGKTTVASLLPRLYDVEEGCILLDGHDIRELRLHSLRRQIGVAFEDPILFSASVHENLVMGRDIQSGAEVKRALEVARAEFVWDLPWGLETRVGEQGYTLSGGQRQRLALARAVLGRPQVLVLDDPLSSVDVHTEGLIEEALRSVLQGVTALVVVHRPSTLALADRVALLDEGLIVAAGTHKQLMASQQLYRRLLSEEFEEVAS